MTDVTPNTGLGTAYFAPAVPNQAYVANAATGAATLLAAQMAAGAIDTIVNMTGITGAANLTTDTAAAILAAIPNAKLNSSYRLRIMNTGGAFSWTVVAGAGVTLTGTMTIAQNTYRDFVVTVTSLTNPAVTLQSLGQYAIGAGV